MNEFILNNLNLPDLSSVLDSQTLKLKFSQSSFTDIAIKKYINYHEEEFLIDKKSNSESPRYFIAFSCFQGPVSLLLKKVMPNFDFKTPFNMLDNPQL